MGVLRSEGTLGQRTLSDREAVREPSLPPMESALANRVWPTARCV